MIDPTTLATIMQAVGQSAPAAAAATSTGIPPMPVSAISQAPAQLAAMQSGGVNNIGSTLASMGATPPAPPASATPPASAKTGGLKSMMSGFEERLEKVNSEIPAHHALMQSGAQYVPLEAPRTTPYATTASGLFDMLQNMYGA
jgi:hypothetical protein